VDVFADETGAIWVGVHFGSRGLGHTVASGFLALSQGKQWGERVPEAEALVALDQPLGHDYWHLMTLAGEYAYAGREWVARKVVSLLGGRELELVHNHHNFAWKETHDGTEYVVVRKGATPAFPGQRGSWGVHGRRRGHHRRLPTRLGAAARVALLHGARRGPGDVTHRSAWQGEPPDRGANRPGRVTWEMLRKWIGEKGVILRGGGLDESPQAYRRLPDVLTRRATRSNLLHTLTPLIVVMAGEKEFDPYRD